MVKFFLRSVFCFFVVVFLFLFRFFFFFFFALFCVVFVLLFVLFFWGGLFCFNTVLPKSTALKTSYPK